MGTKRFLGFVKLGKPFSGTLIGVGIIAFAFFVSAILGVALDLHFLFLITTSTVFCGKFISIHNDIMDYECDCKDDKKSNKPLVSGILLVKDAWHYAYLTLIISLIAAYFVSFEFLVVIVALLVDGYVYNTYGKSKGYIFGNMQVSLASSSVLIIGAMVVTQGKFELIILSFIPCYIGMFGIETYREIMNAVMDFDADFAVGYKTLPVVAGIWKAKIIGWLFLSFGASWLWYTITFGWGMFYNTGVVVASVLSIIGALLYGCTKRNATKDKVYRHYLRICALIFLFFVVLEGIF